MRSSDQSSASFEFKARTAYYFMVSPALGYMEIESIKEAQAVEAIAEYEELR